MNKINDENILLKVRNVKKFFHTPSGTIKAIDDVSFDVKQGEIVGLIGESGSGKTTVGRCLIRLYDEYSGLVSLGNQIISGKKLTKKQRLYLNQNVQMIFQDPHASLNTQHNIYQILKEPLKVNKIMKMEYNDFFSDWKKVTDNFRYSFREKVARINLNTAKYHTLEAKKYLEEWKGVMKNINFNYKNIENDFNQYYAFLLSGQTHETNVVTRNFENNTKIFNYYFECQQNFRNDSILFTEQELKKTKKELDEAINLSKKTVFSYEKNKKYIEIKDEYKKSSKEYLIHKKNMKNIILSYIKEFKNDYQTFYDLANNTKQVIDYNKKIKFYYVYKKMYKLLVDTSTSLLFLNNEDFDELITKFKQYKDVFLQEVDINLVDLQNKKYKNNVKKFIGKKFVFSFEKYQNLSTKNQEIRLSNIDSLKSKLIEIKNWKPNIKQEKIERRKRINDTVDLYEKLNIEYDGIKTRNLIEFKEYLSKLDLQMRILIRDSSNNKGNRILKLILERIFSEVKEQYHKLLFLTIEQIENFFEHVKSVQHNVFEEIKFNEKLKKQKWHLSRITKYLNNHYSNILELDSFISLSEKNQKSKMDNIISIRNKIEILNKSTIPSKMAVISSNEIEKLLDKYNKMRDVNNEEIEKFLVNYKVRMHYYEKETKKQLNELEKIRKELKIVQDEFDNKHEEFLDGLKTFLKLKGKTRKQIKIKLSLYDNKVKSKKDSLKTFDVEIKNLKRDFVKIKHVLGITRSKRSILLVKKILINEKIYNALEEVGLLRQFAWRYPHEFSGGQRQRIVIARALISNPKLIIADEPIASLDVSIQAQVVNILKDLCDKKNVSLIFIAHDLSMVEYIADKILIMHLGKIVELGETNEIYSNPLHPYTINLFKSIPKISNANIKFESSSFELKYLEEQSKKDIYIDFFKVNDNHDIYGTMEQFRKWTSQEPKISEFTKNITTFNKEINKKSQLQN